MRTFVISTMAAGGSARAAANLASHFAARGDDVEILTLYGGADAYPLHPRIRRRDLGFGRMGDAPSAESRSTVVSMAARFPGLPRLAADANAIAALRDVLAEEPREAVIGVEHVTAVRAILATRGLRMRTIAWEQIDPFGCVSPWRNERVAIYPMADAVVVPAPAHAAAFPGAKCVAIPNPAMASGVRRPSRRSGSAIIAVGRLSWEKQFDLLIVAFSRIAERNPDWTITIYGEGSERAKLDRLVREHGLDGRVFLPGTTRDIWSALAAADLFVLPSYVEGWVNALLEAMAAGVAPLVVPCGAAAELIVRDGVDGLRVPRTIDAVAGGMERLMRDPELRERLAARAPEVVERFSIERVAAQFDALLGTFERDGILFPIPVLTRDEADDYAKLAGDPDAEANPHLRFEWARELAGHPAVVQAAEAVLGDCEVLSTQTLFKPPHSRAFVSWHQDSAWRDFGPGEVASAWIALTDAGTDNGCMQVVRGSHRARVPHRDQPEADNMIRLGKHAEADVEPERVTDVVLRAGEMSLHHNDLLHGSRPNESEGARAGFVVRFRRAQGAGGRAQVLEAARTPSAPCAPRPAPSDEGKTCASC
jgi:glycosyltransferase involved in cell wall biosynthesis